MVSASTLILCHLLLSWLTFRFPALERLVDGKAQALISNGHLNKDLMREERITRDDIEAALRAGGCLHLREVERATLETDGSITVVLRRRDSENDGDPPV